MYALKRCLSCLLFVDRHISTICRDVKVLKQLSQRFVFDLAKGDLEYYYKQCINGLDEIRREAWSLYKYGDWSQGVQLSVKEKIAALTLLNECNEYKFALLEKGPSVLNVKGMREIREYSNSINRSIDLRDLASHVTIHSFITKADRARTFVSIFIVLFTLL
ncbi:MAG: hypothetical protein ACRD47_14670 [Nitrososphaeraceae archaeon]